MENRWVAGGPPPNPHGRSMGDPWVTHGPAIPVVYQRETQANVRPMGQRSAL